MANNYSIHAALWGAAKFPGMTGAAVQVGRATRLMAHSGAMYSRLASAGQYTQAVSLRCRALKTLFSKLSATGVPCADLSAAGSLVLAAAAADDVLPAFVSGSNHELMTIAKGLVCLRSLSWGAVGEGIEAEVGVTPLSADGDASGWAIAAGALPTLATAEEDYDLHSAQWAGADLTGMEGLSIAIDTGATARHNPGKIYPTYIRQSPSGAPVAITAQFTLPDRSKLRTYGQHFAGGAIANLVLACRPFAQAAARDSTAGNQFNLTLAGVAEVTDAEDGRPSSVKVTVHGVSADGVTSPLTWSFT